MEKIAAIGTWDGVHLGHQFLLRTLVDEGTRLGLQPLAVTFANHPLSLIRPADAPALLCSVDERLRRIKQAGVGEILLLTFNEHLRALTARQFMDMLRSEHGVRAVMLGFNNAFGSDRLKYASDYAEVASSLGMTALFAPEYPSLLSAGISSSQIRELVYKGDVEEAAQMLGRPYELDGIVLPGRQIGRTIGYPTANIAPPQGRVLPQCGVYACRAYVDGGEYPAVVNIGHRPTVDRQALPPVTIEAHLVGFEGDIYGHNVSLAFRRRLRPEHRFPNLEALRSQIAADIDACMSL